METKTPIKMKIALIPAYQPEPILTNFVQKILQCGYQTIVIDDGSGRKFQEIFCQIASITTVLTHEKNLGKGQALKTGMHYVQENFSGDYIIVTLDADGQHRMEDAEKICQHAMLHPEKLTLGSRKLQRKAPLRSRFGNAMTHFVYCLSTGVNVHDTQTGLRAFSNQLLPELIEISGCRYEYEMNVLMECAKKKIPIHEIEIETIYLNNNASSHFDTIHDSCRIYHEILKFSASSLFCFVVDYLSYCLLLLLTKSFHLSCALILSNIMARIISASLNYSLNRRMVFRSKKSLSKSALQYFLLAALILFCNTLVLQLLTVHLGLNQYVAKICTELVLFLFSWTIQHYVIFRNGRES